MWICVHAGMWVATSRAALPQAIVALNGVSRIQQSYCVREVVPVESGRGTQGEPGASCTKMSMKAWLMTVPLGSRPRILRVELRYPTEIETPPESMRHTLFGGGGRGKWHKDVG